MYEHPHVRRHAVLDRILLAFLHETTDGYETGSESQQRAVVDVIVEALNAIGALDVSFHEQYATLDRAGLGDLDRPCGGSGSMAGSTLHLPHAYQAHNGYALCLGRNLPPMGPELPSPDGHELFDCQRDEPGRHDDHRPCMFCDGGLSLCRVCGAFEGAWPDECPREQMTADQSDAVYAATLNYRAGAWREGEACVIRTPWDERVQR